MTTPGPWRWEPRGERWELIGGKAHVLADLRQNGNNSGKRGASNRALIAAAPDMRDALARLVENSDHAISCPASPTEYRRLMGGVGGTYQARQQRGECNCDYGVALSALKKAEGKTR